jgi:hypothetical protein
MAKHRLGDFEHRRRFLIRKGQHFAKHDRCLLAALERAAYARKAERDVLAHLEHKVGRMDQGVKLGDFILVGFGFVLPVELRPDTPAFGCEVKRLVRPE